MLLQHDACDAVRIIVPESFVRSLALRPAWTDSRAGMSDQLLCVYLRRVTAEVTSRSSVSVPLDERARSSRPLHGRSDLLNLSNSTASYFRVSAALLRGVREDAHHSAGNCAGIACGRPVHSLLTHSASPRCTTASEQAREMRQELAAMCSFHPGSSDAEGLA